MSKGLKSALRDNLSSTLLLTEDGEMRRRRALTYPGMASWGGAQGTNTCRQCLFWMREGYYSDGRLKEARCNKARQMFGRRDTPRVPHHALACEHFAANPVPPAAFKGKGHAQANES